MKNIFYLFILLCFSLFNHTALRGDIAFVTDYSNNTIYRFDTADLSTPATPIFTNLNGPYGITTDTNSQTIYFAALGGDIYSFPIQAPYTTPTALDTGLSGPADVAISSDGTFGLATQPGGATGIFSFPINGSSHTATQLTATSTVVENPSAIAIKGNTAYVASSASSSLYSFPANDSSYAATQIQATFAEEIATSNNGFIYYVADSNEVYQLPVASPTNTPTLVGSAPAGTIFRGVAVSIDNNTVFAVSLDQGIYTFPTNQPFPVTPTLQSALNIPSPRYITIATQNPVVQSVSPNFGPYEGGTNVTIRGYNFTGTTAVSFGVVPATSFTVISDNEITAVSPAESGGTTINIFITNSDGVSEASTNDEFTYIRAPSITSLSPTTGPTTGGTSVTITGLAFSTATAVDFGTTAASSYTIVSNTEIIAVSPPGTGSVAVRVTNPAGTSPLVDGDLFTYEQTSDLLPPTNVAGCRSKKCVNNCLDIINLLTWQAPASGETPVSYKIYRDASLTRLAGTVTASAGQEYFKFEDHHRKSFRLYTYFIVSVDGAGNQSSPVSVTVINKCKN